MTSITAVNGIGIGDEWDDKELIKEYNKQVKTWRKSKKSSEEDSTQPATAGPGPWVSVVDKKQGQLTETDTSVNLDLMESSRLAVGNWIIGSPCRAVWNLDGLEYEAKVVAIEGPRCTIRFVGYGNEEKKELNDLKDTFGKRSRDRQRREAQIYNYSVNGELDVEEYYSSVSLTSSMYNNCPDTTIKDDDQQTTTTECSGYVRPTTLAPKNHKKNKNTKRKRDEVSEAMSVDDQEPTRLDIDNPEAEDVLPSGAEATMGSSSSSDISVGEEGDDEATSGPLREAMKNFPSMVPRFPIPPMPMSLAGADGKFDFGRGQLPSLLLSWYMSGYHAGYFDARQELSGATLKNGKNKDEAKSRPKRP